MSLKKSLVVLSICVAQLSCAALKPNGAVGDTLTAAQPTFWKVYSSRASRT